MRLSDDEIRGRTIIAADGQVIGEIDGLLVGTDDWRVESLQVTVRKEVADDLGAQRSVFHAGKIEIPTRMVQAIGTTVVLSVPLLELRAVLPSEREPTAAAGPSSMPPSMPIRTLDSSAIDAAPRAPCAGASTKRSTPASR